MTRHLLDRPRRESAAAPRAGRAEELPPILPFTPARQFDEPEEPTLQVEAAYVVQMAAESRERDEVTPPPTSRALPPPTPLGPEARDFADRCRYALRFLLGFGDEEAEAVIRFAKAHMPGGRR